MKIFVGRNLKATAVFLTFWICMPTSAQDTLRVRPQQAEAIFLQENLMLLAERLNIPHAEAALMQAKLWPNPELEVDEFNFRTGARGQYAISVDQLILTAGKRKKLMALEQISVDQSRRYFEDLLRNIRFEFRSTIITLRHLQHLKATYEKELGSVSRLTTAYQKQVEQGNISRNEYIRLKAMELEIRKDISDAETALNDAQGELKMFLNLPYSHYVRIISDEKVADLKSYESLSLAELIAQAKETRPDLMMAELDKRYFDRLHLYEKAQAVPDIRIKAGYDRAGGIYDHFFGIGAAIDLPLFNRNQGNIRQAQIARQQADILAQHTHKKVENEITLAFANLQTALSFLRHIEPDYEQALDEMLDAYTRNFLNRNIGMLEYLDFLEAYISNKKILLDNLRNISERTEELNFSTGMDLLNDTL